MGGPEAADREHDVGARKGESQRRHQPSLIVTYRLARVMGDAQLRQERSKVLGVRIGDLPHEELGANTHDLGDHGVAGSRRSTLTIRTVQLSLPPSMSA